MSQAIDKTYWSALVPPLAPSKDDVLIFTEYLLEGEVLLLGCTKHLLHLSTSQLDQDPYMSLPTLQIGDWRENKRFYHTIIGDGVFNFDKDLTHEVLLMASKYAKRLIVRCFNYKLPTMRVAAFFPNAESFSIRPTKTITSKEYSFYIWDF
jgi:hypothetical protein